MRPTLLQFRSPKERTPDGYYPTVSPEGRPVQFSSPKGDKRKSTFPTAKRFSQYDIDSKRTGFMVGPGTYKPDNLNIGNARMVKVCLYKPLHNNKDTTHNGYYMVGDNIIYDGRFKSWYEKRHSIDTEARVERLSMTDQFPGSPLRSSSVMNKSFDKNPDTRSSSRAFASRSTRPSSLKNRSLSINSSLYDESPIKKTEETPSCKAEGGMKKCKPKYYLTRVKNILLKKQKEEMQQV